MDYLQHSATTTEQFRTKLCIQTPKYYKQTDKSFITLFWSAWVVSRQGRHEFLLFQNTLTSNDAQRGCHDVFEGQDNLIQRNERNRNSDLFHTG